MRKLLTMVMLLVSPYVFAADEIYTGFFSSKALDGYDTVAYFTSGKPIEAVSYTHLTLPTTMLV